MQLVLTYMVKKCCLSKCALTLDTQNGMILISLCIIMHLTHFLPSLAALSAFEPIIGHFFIHIDYSNGIPNLFSKY